MEAVEQAFPVFIENANTIVFNQDQGGIGFGIQFYIDDASGRGEFYSVSEQVADRATQILVIAIDQDRFLLQL
ncbi:hypothetical protein Pelsub_P1000 [Pelolinea submarina]|nr:hypothetical protein Pelsub_P1000 [Pelolinea submarina]